MKELIKTHTIQIMTGVLALSLLVSAYFVYAGISVRQEEHNYIKRLEEANKSNLKLQQNNETLKEIIASQKDGQEVKARIDYWDQIGIFTTVTSMNEEHAEFAFNIWMLNGRYPEVFTKIPSVSEFREMENNIIYAVLKGENQVFEGYYLLTQDFGRLVFELLESNTYQGSEKLDTTQRDWIVLDMIQMDLETGEILSQDSYIQQWYFFDSDDGSYRCRSGMEDYTEMDEFAVGDMSQVKMVIENTKTKEIKVFDEPNIFAYDFYHSRWKPGENKVLLSDFIYDAERDETYVLEGYHEDASGSYIANETIVVYGYEFVTEDRISCYAQLFDWEGNKIKEVEIFDYEIDMEKLSRSLGIAELSGLSLDDQGSTGLFTFREPYYQISFIYDFENETYKEIEEPVLGTIPPLQAYVSQNYEEGYQSAIDKNGEELFKLESGLMNSPMIYIGEDTKKNVVYIEYYDSRNFGFTSEYYEYNTETKEFTESDIKMDFAKLYPLKNAELFSLTRRFRDGIGSFIVGVY